MSFRFEFLLGVEMTRSFSQKGRFRPAVARTNLIPHHSKVEGGKAGQQPPEDSRTNHKKKKTVSAGTS